MKLVDEEGKILGGINLIDFIVVVFAASVILFIAVNLRSEEEWIYVEAVLCNDNPNPLYAEPVECGMTLIPYVDSVVAGDVESSGGETIAEILGKDVDPSLTNSPYHAMAHFQAKIKGKLSGRGVFIFKGERLGVGSRIDLITNKSNLVGLVTKIGPGPADVERAYEGKNVTLLAEEQDPWVAEKIAVGDREVSYGKTFAQVLEKSMVPAEVIVEAKEGGIVKQTHPRNYDVTLKLMIYPVRYGNDLLFKGGRVYVGKKMTLYLGDVEVEGVITDVE